MDDRTKAAVGRLMNNSDFQAFLEYLDGLRAEDAKEGLSSPNKVVIFRAQGAHARLTDVTEKIRSARDPVPRPTPRRIV